MASNDITHDVDPHTKHAAELLEMSIHDMSGKALDYFRDGDYEKAIQASNEVANKMSVQFGPTNESTLDFQTNIGMLHMLNNNNEEAIKIFKHVYETKLHLYGSHDPKTGKIMQKLATTLEKQGKYDEVRKLFSGLTQADELLSELADHLKKEGELENALNFYRDVYEIRLKMYGKNHEQTEACIRRIAHLLIKLGRYYEAFRVYDDLKEGFIDQTALTEALCGKGKFEEALEIYRELYERDAEKWGIDDPERTLVHQEYIAQMYKKMKRADECLEIYSEVLQSRNKSLVEFHEAANDTVEEFVEVLVLMNNADKWLDFLRKHQDDVSSILGPDHEHTIWVLYCLGFALAYRRQYAEALEVYRKLFETLTDKSPKSLKALRSTFPIICMNVLLCNVATATELSKEFFDGLKCVLGKKYHGLKGDILLCYRMKEFLNNCNSMSESEMKLKDFHAKVIAMIISQKDFFMKEH